jgi:S1-C subfamily serine protease
MDFSTVIRDVAQQVRPAVVQITNEQVQIDQFNQSLTVPAGVGSGVIYDTQGHILTNNHVIECAQQLFVSLTDGRSFPAKLVGADPQTDLTVVQITGSNLPVATFGDSAALVDQPLSRVPENTMKFAIGLMLAAFGIFWSVEGTGIAWPGADVAILYNLAFLTLISCSTDWRTDDRRGYTGVHRRLAARLAARAGQRADLSRPGSA